MEGLIIELGIAVVISTILNIHLIKKNRKLNGDNKRLKTQSTVLGDIAMRINDSK